MRTRYLIILFLVLLPLAGAVNAQVDIPQFDVPVTQNFNALASTGGLHNISTLPPGWMFIEEGTGANFTYQTGTGTSTTANTYSFGSNPVERAFGGLQSSTVVPIIGASFVNNTGDTITRLRITYRGEQWRLGTSGRADKLDFQYAIDPNSLLGGTWIDVDPLDFVAPIDSGAVGALNGNLAANSTLITFEFTGFEFNPDVELYIRFVDFDATGADDGLAIDDFSITAIMPPNEGLVPDSVEFLALKAIYDSLGGPNWTTKTNWPATWPSSATSAQFATWFGVTVSNYDIIGVALPNNNLIGDLPSQTGNLIALRNLNLSNNQISGSLHASFGNLLELQNLVLNNNQISGSIPTSLGSLSQLIYLYLYINQLSGPIPAELGNLSSLKYLQLDNNQLSGSIPAQLGDLQNLEHLFLSANQLTGSIPSELGDLSKLTHFYLDANQLEGTIPSSLGALDTLQYLYLNNNLLTGPIPETFADLQQLKLLRLQNNQLSGTIPSGLGELTNLTQLFLSDNQLEGSIPTQLSDLTMLTHLVLSNNQLTGTVPSGLAALPALVLLQANDNELGEIGNFSAAANKANLQLFVANNRLLFSDLEENFTAPGVHPFNTFSYSPQKPIDEVPAIHVTLNEQLQIVAKGPGQYSTITWEWRPNETSAWTNINSVNEDTTQLTLVISGFQNSNTGQYRYVMTNSAVPSLTLTSEPITVVNHGIVPDDVEFNVLKAIYDSLGGPNWTTKTNWPTTWPASATHTEFSTWYGITVVNGNIKEIALANNNLVGLIPTSIGNLSSLTKLNFSNNAISSAIPASIGNLVQLNSLFLHFNKLTSIPQSIANLSGVVQLSDNELKSVPHLTGGPTLVLTRNFLDFSSIEPLTGYLGNVTFAPQKDINDISEVQLAENYSLTIPSRPSTVNTSVVWERKIGPTTWQDVSFQNEDSSGQTFKITNGLAAVGNVYRWKMTNSIVAGLTLTSEPINVNAFSVKWVNLTGVNIDNGGLVKTATSGTWGNGGANSANILSSFEDGWLSFIPDSTADQYVVGFATNDNAFSHTDVPYGAYIHADGQMFWAENGVYTLFGTKEPGDVIKISRVGDQIKFYRNGTELRTATINPALDLKVKSAILTGRGPAVFASFDVRIHLQADITPVNTDGNGGGANVIASRGESPYTYQWSTGSSTLANQPTGTYSLTVTDSLGRSIVRPYDIGYSVNWTGSIGVNEIDGGLVKTTTSGTWENAGANSSNVLSSNEDGWLSFIPDSTSDQYVIGFATNDNGFSHSDVLYGIHIHINGQMFWAENGTYTLFGTKEPGEVIKIWRVGDQIKFYRNGIELRTATANPGLDLKVKSTILTGSSPAVFASFDVRIALKASITSVSISGFGGGANVIASRGKSPYSYQWSTGSSTLSNQQLGTYSLTVTDSLGRSITRPYDIGYSVNWTGSIGVNEIDGGLVKTTTPGTWENAGANSSNLLSSYEDGWLSFIPGSTSDQYVIGFATNDNGFSHTDVLYGIHIHTNGQMFWAENGAYTLFGTKEPGDVLKISRVGNQIKFYRNGAELKTAAANPAVVLKIKSTIATGSSPRIFASFGDNTFGNRSKWIEHAGVSESNGILTRASGSGWDAGANSSNMLAANVDGSLQYVIHSNTSRFIVSLTTFSGNYTPSSVNYGLVVEPGDSLWILEGSDTVENVSAWQVGDTLKIERSGDQIKYFRNGFELHAVTTDPSLELRARALVYSGNAPIVFVSFNVRLSLQASITAVKANGTGGSIQVTPLTGQAPYTYSWQGSGETTPGIFNKNIGSYTVDVADARGVTFAIPFTLGYPVAWTDLTGVTANSPLTRISGEGWDGGANSFNVLAAGQNGWAEFVVNNNTSAYIIGFSEDGTSFNTLSVKYGLSVEPGRKIGAWESSSFGLELSSWQIGDALKIERVGSEIKYYRNGVELRSVSTDSIKELRLKAIVYKGTTPSPVMSVDVPFVIRANITPVKSFGLSGAMSVSPLTGTAPFTYSWSTGELTAGITNKEIGTYSVTVNDSEGRTVSREYELGYKILWTDFTGTAENNDELIKTASGSEAAGANSINVLKPNEDGWMQIVLDNAATNLSIGFATYSGIYNTAAVDYSLNVKPGGELTSTENNWTGVTHDNWQIGDVLKIERAANQVSYFRNGTLLRSVNTDSTKEMIIKAALQSGRLGLAQTSIPAKEFESTPIDESTVVYTIPKRVKVTRDGRLPRVTYERPLRLSEFSADYAEPVFQGCLTGKYIAGFQLYYDLLAERNTTENWSAYVQITLFHNEDSLWTRPLKLKMEDQTFIATAFYDSLISCGDNYFYHVDFKMLEGEVPQENVYLKVLLYKDYDEVFIPAAALTLNCDYNNRITTLSWNYTGQGVNGYDIEWVFIEKHENFSGTTPQEAFQFKEPVRITTAKDSLHYTHQVYYPDGTLYYRARAVGFNPQYPEHRIPGNWFYSPCAAIPIENHQPGMNWQQQTIFAEEGKYKKVMNYFDGSLRQRQVQTNLSTENVTLVGETLYDYEGRGSVNILAVPATDASLVYKPGFNVFKATDPTVVLHTSPERTKFNYDNRKLENSVLDTLKGAGQYYSAANQSNSIHKNFIPEGEGYVYSQTEYLNDGTGRVTRQSGVGKEFRIDGLHNTRYNYGEAAKEELIRLFGNNVGAAEHYKKNIAIDPNGQVSVSYLDQEDRVIATALAGESPDNVDSLQSFKDLDPAPITINLASRNKKSDGVSQTSHKILNVQRNTAYDFEYDLTALASQIEGFGCESCLFDLRIMITDPDGKRIDLSSEAGSQANDEMAYLRTGLNASCADTLVVNDVSFSIVFDEIGEYTIVKTLVAHELSFEQMGELVTQSDSVVAMINQIRNTFAVDSADCEICTVCPEAEQVINDAIAEIADQDCENIFRQIEQEYQDKYQALYEQTHGEPSDEIYEVPSDSIAKHPLYCQYQLCIKNKPGDIFEKQIVRAFNWEDAIVKGYGSLIQVDPFFNDSTLSGFNYKSAMQASLNDVYLTTISGTDYRGPIEEVTDPLNTDFYIDQNGNPDLGGRHILYLDLMGKKAQGLITNSAYDSAISHQRWAVYRGFYGEGKRKIKLTISEYLNCEKAREELMQPDQLPESDEDVLAWGEEHQVIGPVTEEDLDVRMANITFHCDTTFSQLDSIAIRGLLQVYFNKNSRNFFKLILSNDLASDSSLINIQTILNNYNCGLDSLALQDPLVCAEEVIVVRNNPEPETFSMAPEQSFMALTEPEQQTFSGSEETPGQENTPAAEESFISQLALEDEEPSGPMLSLLSGCTTEPSDPAPSGPEYQSLLDLYNATRTIEDPWANEDGWSEHSSEPQSVKCWYGVGVDALGHVISLNLSNNDLKGTLPASIGNLTYLTHLALSGSSNTNVPNRNHIGGTIPASINNLVNLEELQLPWNNITGAIPDISSLTSLLYLDLSGSFGLTSIPSNIGVLEQLEYLDLSFNPFGSLPGSFSQLSSLVTLRLNYCNLIDLPSDFGENYRSLRFLYLGGNQLTSLPDNFRGAEESFDAMNSLEILSLTSNQLTALPPNFGRYLTTLKDLYLYGNQLTSLPDHFHGMYYGMRGLKRLYISINVTGFSAFNPLLETLPPNFGKEWTSLVELHMERGKLTSLPDYFRGNNSSGDAMNNLTILNLGQHALASLPPHFGENMLKLTELRLNGNKLTSLPDYFHGATTGGNGLNTLRILWLNDNLLAALPPHFGDNWPTLQDLYLSNNKLVTLPDFFRGSSPTTGNCLAGLRTLHLYFNELTSLPPHFGDNWVTLNTLLLYRNKLTSLPDYFHGANASGNGMNNLRVLYLGNRFANTNNGSNELTSLPEHFGENLSELQDLHIEGNKLTSLPDHFKGTTPEGIGMPKLRSLYLNNNLLASLPSLFGKNLINLEFLYLYDNKLTSLPDYFRGSHPTLGDAMNKLKTLYLGWRTGNFTLTYSSHPQLERFAQTSSQANYGSNELTSLPANFAHNWTEINELRLEGNKLISLPDIFKGTTASGTGMPKISILSISNNLLASLPEHFGEGLVNLTDLSLHANMLTSLPDYFRGNNGSGDAMNKLRTLRLGYSFGTFNLGGNELTTLPPNFGAAWTDMQELHLEGNKLQVLTDYFHGDLLSGMGKLTKLFIHQNLLTSLPANFGQGWSTLTQLAVNDNNLTSFSYSDSHFANLELLFAMNNELTTFPASLWTLIKLKSLIISGNQMSGIIPANIPVSITQFDFANNRFTFSDFLQVKNNFEGHLPHNFTYANQQKVDLVKTITVSTLQPVVLTTQIDRNLKAALGPEFNDCTYQWFRATATGGFIALNVPPDTSHHTITINPTLSDDRNRYYYTIRNAGGSNLILTSNIQTLRIHEPKIDTVCVTYDSNNPTLDLFTFEVDWAEEVRRCMANAAREDSILTEYAIGKFIEEEITTFYNTFKTNCLEDVSENLKYTYGNKEYHYTLYYYDQAGNLVQTVPPQGVDLLTPEQIDDALNGSVTNPQHALVTKYEYNSLNQLVHQQTPDAGESNFWYNDKGQLKLSQNARQDPAKNYSYTKYDELGRVTEVGEMNTEEAITALQTRLDSLSFPKADSYTLSDITRTLYDFAKPGLEGMQQTNLRNRVSYVEVIEKDQPDTIATYYTYDIHGNVTSLLQQVPGLEKKRTDYAYDLVSGKVNYVMYQYDKADEFIHRYTYDADNRIVDVYTSSDGFIWDKDASYKYYLHGPLARTELGEYRVQGLDYLYTLQGWIKGVNGLLDPGADGATGSIIPKDEFSYNVGFFENDYKGIGIGTFSNNYQLAMQQYTDLMGNNGLFNGNIAWMTTDLKKIGQIKGKRTEGMQAMLYRYDQLHRIIQGRSLTNFDVNTGFTAKTSEAYDEDYTYDANGNILTLQRRDQLGAMMDDFNYSYYTGTNKLRQLIPVERDTIYSGGPVRSNQKVYRNITITGTSYVESGADVVLKATNNIDIDEDFDVSDDGSFHAYVLPEEEGMYLYDEIGNLIWDQEEGVKIDWTPYGKVRKIVKGDSTTVTFLYDGAGNRIVKKVERADTIYITCYLRDASGNVTAIYNGSVLTEQPIYGSSRVGMYLSGRRAGHRTLGLRKFELNNHLSNVLVVLTDNVYMNSDSTWTNVSSVNDYYPFGLTMEGRIYSDSTYRYGFNGMEKDEETGTYIAKHWEYDSRLGRRWNVDPVVKPHLSPYSCLSNSPITRVDPYGDDDFFDSQGNLILRTKVGTAVHILNSSVQDFNDAHYKATHMYKDDRRVNAFLKAYSDDITSIKITKDNLQTEGAKVANVMHFYYKEAGLKDDIDFGFSKGYEGDGTIAETVTPPTETSFPLYDDKIHHLLNTSNNIMAVLAHEWHHAYGKENSQGSNKLRHLNAYYFEATHSSWAGTTDEFKKSTINSIGRFLDNATGTDEERKDFRAKFEKVFGGEIKFNGETKNYEVTKK